jgi:hypothetical protein
VLSLILSFLPSFLCSLLLSISHSNNYNTVSALDTFKESEKQ